MKAYMELQTKKLEMEEAINRRKLEIQEAVQTKKLDIVATNAKTKAKDVALALMTKEVEIMTMNLSTLSPRKSGSRGCWPTSSSSMIDL